MQNIKWFSVPRANLPDSVHGFAVPPREEISPLLIEKTVTDGLAIGFLDTPSRTTPAVIGLVESSRAADLFSWLSTFAPEAFPISQSFRVLSFTDWHAGIDSLVPRTQFPKEAIWPSLIVGEIIGQGEREQDIGSIPLSRVFASFTYAQARAYLLYEKNPQLIHECRQRLALLETDASFVKRTISVSELSMMWDITDGVGDNRSREIIQFVADLLDDAAGKTRQPLPIIFERAQLNLEHILSDSIEQRVLEFERAVERISRVGKHDTEASLAVAALTMLVGRSTTHITLLDEFSQEFPTAVSWFGLLAGLIGPEVWDDKWLRLSTSVEKLLRVSVSLFDPTMADLCWIEYNWIRGLRQSAAWLKETPKLYPRVLSVEILPGVSCQLRLQDGISTASRATPSTKSIAVDVKEQPLVRVTDPVKDQRAKLLAQVKSELARVTETMSKLEYEEGQQQDLFSQNSAGGLIKKSVATRKTAKKSPNKKPQNKLSQRKV